MKFCVAAVLALSVAPAHSFSYLDQLGSATAVASSVDIAPPAYTAPAPAASNEAPFFFTNGAADEPADSPAFFFTSGSTDIPAATSSGSYLDALGGAGSAVAPPAPAAVSGAAGSSTSYLSILGSGATSVSGPGVTSYLDALPQNSAVGGAGISTYASSLNEYASEIVGSAPSAPQVAAPAPVAAAPAAFVSAIGSAAMATSSGSYLDALATAASQTSGAGITTYVESLPLTAALVGGAGLNTYASNLVSSSNVSGPGIPTYADALCGGIPSFTNSFSPFSGASISASGSDVNFTMGSVTGYFDFALEASPAMMAKLKAAGRNSVRITGSFY
jgi:hypothetical protein